MSLPEEKHSVNKTVATVIATLVCAALVGSTGYAWTKVDNNAQRLTVVEVEVATLKQMRGEILAEIREMKTDLKELSRVVKGNNGR